MKNKRSNWRPTLLCFSRESYTCPWWKTGGLTVPASPHPTPGRDDKQPSSGRTAFLGSHSKLRGFISLLHPNLGAVDSSYLTLSNSGFLLRLNSASQLPLQELEMLAQPFSPRDPPESEARHPQCLLCLERARVSPGHAEQRWLVPSPQS